MSSAMWWMCSEIDLAVENAAVGVRIVDHGFVPS
jgi:hypothetical protein